MLRVINGRGTGKTSYLFLLAKERDAAVVCSNPNAMAEKAKGYGIIGLEFYSYADLLQGGRLYGTDKDVLIDELEMFVKAAACRPVIGYSLTNED